MCIAGYSIKFGFKVSIYAFDRRNDSIFHANLLRHDNAAGGTRYQSLPGTPDAGTLTS